MLQCGLRLVTTIQLLQQQSIVVVHARALRQALAGLSQHARGLRVALCLDQQQPQ